VKKIILATVLAGIGSTAALAADLGARTYTKAPAIVAPVATWTGWYAGLNAGWAGGGDGVSTSAAVSPASTTVPSNALGMAEGATSSSRGSNSFIGGGQFGYNYQFSPLFVAGFEADIQALSRSRSSSSSSVFPPFAVVGTGFATNVTTTSDPAYLGTFRARLGVTVNPSVLLYVTGGLAYGEAKSDTAIFQSGINATNGAIPFTITPASGAFSGMRVGYAVGAGGEWMFASNWSAKLEYLYYDLGSATYSSGSLVSSNFGPTNFPGGGIGVVDTSAKARFNDHIVRVGVNYHF
jgi:outer membrane immunogenic protein